LCERERKVFLFYQKNNKKHKRKKKPMTDLGKWEEQLRAGKALNEREMRLLCRQAIEVLVEEPNVRSVRSPASICGDIHGQFMDLLELLRIGGDVNKTSSTHFVFLGDLVDRGVNSIETLSLLLVLKVRYPDKITLLRGNHESRQVTSMYGFMDECSKKYGSNDVWRACTDVFDCFPIAALIDGENLCVHGGLSPQLRKIDQIRMLSRRNEMPHTGPISDLMWSDPEASVDGFVLSPRGAGYLFGGPVTREFMWMNSLSLISRAHQVVNEGYKYHFDEERLVTVWSAPNYCYRCGNLASFLTIFEDGTRQFTIFEEVENQYIEGTGPSANRPVYFL
jgi:diadenosine tetraphosphatase ApaH/serine/threonine PP2A family protein phosphatase